MNTTSAATTWPGRRPRLLMIDCYMLSADRASYVEYRTRLQVIWNKEVVIIITTPGPSLAKEGSSACCTH